MKSMASDETPVIMELKWINILGFSLLTPLNSIVWKFRLKSSHLMTKNNQIFPLIVFWSQLQRENDSKMLETINGRKDEKMLFFILITLSREQNKLDELNKNNKVEVQWEIDVWSAYRLLDINKIDRKPFICRLFLCCYSEPKIMFWSLRIKHLMEITYSS